MTTSPDSLFPYPDIPEALPTSRKPTLHDIRTLRKHINANAMAITSTRGGGAHGHLALVMTPASYTALSGVAWVDPVHPGAAPAIPAGATAAQITEINRQYKADLEEFMLFKATQAALRKCLIQAIPATYIDILADELFEYANVTPSAILAHLTTMYGQVTADDLAENMQHLQAQWHPDQPLEDLWKQLRRCQAFAMEHDAISDATAIREAILNLEKSGVFTDTLKDWRRRPQAEHTIVNLHADFNRADKERRRTTTSSDAGYANAVVSTKTHPKAPSTSNKENDPTCHPTRIGVYYCWTHGLSQNAAHTSSKCTNKSEGHCDNATLTNMMGGNNRIHRAPGETTVYKFTRRPRDGTTSSTPKE